MLAAALHARQLRVRTVDLMTDGRFELGIGAGWMAADYASSGLPFESAATRVARLAGA